MVMAGWKLNLPVLSHMARTRVPSAVMQDAMVDISGQESTRVTDEMLEQADLVVTVYGHAVRCKNF